MGKKIEIDNSAEKLNIKVKETGKKKKKKAAPFSIFDGLFGKSTPKKDRELTSVIQARVGGPIHTP